MSHLNTTKNQLVDGTINYKIICYYYLPKKNTTSSLTPGKIDPHLCTHINVAFATVVNNSIFLSTEQLEIAQDVMKLKQKNKNLRVLLSIGGASNAEGFPMMVLNHRNRKT